jgi:hypothetical protein
MCPAHAVAEAGSRSSRRTFLAGVCLAIALLVPVASGCSTLLTAAYLIAPQDTPAEYKGLKGKHVAVICKPIVELEFSDAGSSRELAGTVGALIERFESLNGLLVEISSFLMMLGAVISEPVASRKKNWNETEFLNMLFPRFVSCSDTEQTGLLLLKQSPQFCMLSMIGHPP